MSQKLTATLKPWYRYREPWLLMLGPFVVVVAGLGTAYLAFKSNDGLVDDDYYKQGLTVNQLTSRDRRARELDLHAELAFDKPRNLIRVVVQVGKLAVFPETLRLSIVHPTRSGLDQSLTLLRADGSANGSVSYAAGLAVPLTGRWRIALEDDRREWRLADDWDIEKQTTFKLPAATNGMPQGMRFNSDPK